MASISTAAYDKRRGSRVDTLCGDELFVLPRYRPKDLGKLCLLYNFDKREVRQIYQGFKQECPNGVCTEELFASLYAKLFPLGDATCYAHHVFRACKRYTQRDSLNFESFLSVLSCISRGSLTEKMTWVFNLYDIERKGKITKKSMLEIYEAVNAMLTATSSVISSSEASCPLTQVDRVFKEMDTNCDGKITFEEFANWCCRDKERVDSLLMFDTVF